MGWRTVIVDNRCKLAYKNGYLLLKKEEDTLIHISEIDVLVVATTQVTFTCVAISELIKSKVKIIFCDEKHNPLAEVCSQYTSYNTSKKIVNQINWKNGIKDNIFAEIIRQKIKNQAKVLFSHSKEEDSRKLIEFASQVECGDVTNREGHSAKVYFNTLFGQSFSRGVPNPINSALDYGYAIILSYINREVVASGYVTQLGIKHCNEFNQFNLSCDFIEPFRPFVDDFVATNLPQGILTKEYKYQLIGLLSHKVKFQNKETHLSSAISESVKSILVCLDENTIEKIKLFEL